MAAFCQRNKRAIMPLKDWLRLLYGFCSSWNGLFQRYAVANDLNVSKSNINKSTATNIRKSNKYEMHYRKKQNTSSAHCCVNQWEAMRIWEKYDALEHKVLVKEVIQFPRGYKHPLVLGMASDSLPSLQFLGLLYLNDTNKTRPSRMSPVQYWTQCQTGNRNRDCYFSTFEQSETQV